MEKAQRSWASVQADDREEEETSWTFGKDSTSTRVFGLTSSSVKTSSSRRDSQGIKGVVTREG